MLLAVIKNAVGSLDRVRRVVKVFGMVNAIPEFTEQPKSSTAVRTYSCRSSASAVKTLARR